MIINLRVVQCVGKKLSRLEEGGSAGCGKGNLRDNNVSSKLFSLSFSFFLNNINNAMCVFEIVFLYVNIIISVVLK